MMSTSATISTTTPELAIYGAGGLSYGENNWPKRAGPMNQEGRVLAALGKAGGALPRVSIAWLLRYCDYLEKTLVFPFDAVCPEESGTLRPWTSAVSVVELVPPAGLTNVNDTGLLCKARTKDATIVEVPLIDLEVADAGANAQLIEDYWYWFWNWRFDPQI